MTCTGISSYIAWAASSKRSFFNRLSRWKGPKQCVPIL